jgi:CDP-glucose 4,6-dehydratase
MLAEGLAAETSRFACGWNFGPAEADAKPVAWIADELMRLWGADASWICDARTHLPEAGFLKLDASKARACLDWHPVLPLNQALGWIVEWYRAFQVGADLASLTCTQINRYEALLQKPNLTAQPTATRREIPTSSV